MRNEKYAEIKILCIEDEPEIRANQVDYLKRIFQHVYESSNAKDALRLIDEVKPHIVITDIQMDDINGLELIGQTRKTDKKTKFIVLSAFSNKEYLFEAIELGLVKYLIKPIDHATFYPVITQCANEVLEENSSLIQLNDDTVFDTTNLQLKVENKAFTLSKYESDFLKLLYKNRPNVVTYERIQYEVWEDNIMSDESLRTLVKALRKKLPKNMIGNLSKVGYKLTIETNL